MDDERGDDSDLTKVDQDDHQPEEDGSESQEGDVRGPEPPTDDAPESEPAEEEPSDSGSPEEEPPAAEGPDSSGDEPSDSPPPEEGPPDSGSPDGEPIGPSPPPEELPDPSVEDHPEPSRPEHAPPESEGPAGDRPENPLDRPVDDEGDPEDDRDEPTFERPDDEDLDPDGPPDDQEMPLTEHIEEMVLRLASVFAIAGVVTAIAFPFAQEPITYIWFSILPGEEIAQPRVYGPLELKLTELKFASLAGLIAAMPMAVYQTYRFMRPGLYPHERRYYLAAIPTSLVLAFVGIAFAFFIILPAIFTYFMYYSENAGEIAFALQETFNLIIIMKAFMAITFQIPLLIMLAIMMGVTTRRWLENRRLYFWAGFLGISFVFSPDPTGMAPIMVAGTMVALFEGTLAALRWTGN